jgi:FkbM family methyltransferase
LATNNVPGGWISPHGEEFRMTLGLIDLTERYQAGKLSKSEFIEAMTERHSSWFEYAEYLRGSEVASIEILPGQVILTSTAGVKIQVDPLDRRQPIVEALHFRSYEKADAAMLYALTPARGVVFDIGANRGWYSLHLAKRFPGLRIHAFEPLPAVFGSLLANVALNQASNVTAHNFALSNRTGTARFFFNSKLTVASSAANLLGTADAREVDVTLRTLDAAQAEWGTAIDLIKCDVEGAELLVFQGGMKALARCRPVIFCEMLRKWAAKFEYHPNDIIALLATAGYRCNTAANGRLVPVALVDEKTEATNFFFLHEDAHARLVAVRA